jgi:hypothetical protein
LCFPLCGSVNRDKKLYLPACEDRNRQAIAIDQSIARKGSKPSPWGQNTDEIEWIRAGKRDPLAGGRPSTGLS